jgi:conjugative transfer signal peptidase TraF
MRSPALRSKKPRKPWSPKKTFIRIAIFGVMELAALWGLARQEVFAINGSRSLPSGVYIRDFSGDRPLHRGDIVSFCPPPVAAEYAQKYLGENGYERYCGETHAYLKMAAGLPGDRVTLSDRGVSINGGPVLPGSQPLTIVPGEHNTRHRLPTLARKTYLLGPGEIWSYTPQWYSFDSRYYGPVHCIHKMRPFIVGDKTLWSTVPTAIVRMQPK